MQKIKLFFIFAVISLLTGCSQNYQRSDNKPDKQMVLPIPAANLVSYQKNAALFSIPLNTVEEKVGTPEIFDQSVMEVVLLSDEFTIGEIDKVLVSDDKIIVLDRFSTRSVSCFDRSGNFLWALNQHGQGPQEFVHPQDVFLEEETGKVVLFADGKELMYYDQNGQYEKTVRLPAFGFFANSLGPGQVVVYTGTHVDDPQNNYYLHFYEVRGDSASLVSVNAPYPLEYQRYSRAQGGCFSRTADGKLLHYRPFSDTVYQITADRIEPYVVMDYQDKAVPLKYKKSVRNYLDYLENQANVQNQIERPNLFWETESQIFVKSYDDDQCFLTFYDKAGENSRTVPCKRLGSGILTGLLGLTPLGITDDDRVVYDFPTYEAHDLVKKYRRDGNSQEKVEWALKKDLPFLYYIYKNTSKHSNPALVFTKVRDDFFTEESL